MSILTSLAQRNLNSCPCLLLYCMYALVAMPCTRVIRSLYVELRFAIYTALISHMGIMHQDAADLVPPPVIFRSLLFATLGTCRVFRSPCRSLPRSSTSSSTRLDLYTSPWTLPCPTKCGSNSFRSSPISCWGITRFAQSGFMLEDQRRDEHSWPSFFSAEKAVDDRLAKSPETYLLALAQSACSADTEVVRRAQVLHLAYYTSSAFLHRPLI
jgi:hypothetical protein